MARLLTLEDLNKQFEQARSKLSLDRREILDVSPLPDNFNRDEYGFSYMRAERIGMEVIGHCLQEVSWLPMRLDAQFEIVLENNGAIKKWLNSSSTKQPDSSVFGNDFIHALTRIALKHGWDSSILKTHAIRVGDLFRDLSCLLGLIYYSVWMAENGIEGLPISNPDDLERTAQEIALMTRSPEIAQLLYSRKKALEESRAQKKTKKVKPILRVIENTNWGAAPVSPPLTT